MYDDDTGTDGRISTLFHDTTAQIEPDVSGLVRGGIDRGRVKRRWRNVGTAFVAAAAVGVVGVAASVVPSFGPDGAGTEPAGAPAPAVAAPAATPERAAAETLKKLLPANLRVSKVHTERDKQYGAINVEMLVDDGTGPAQVSLRLGSSDLAPCADKEDRCRVRKDGSAITIGGDRPGKVDPSGLRAHNVVITHRDRTFIMVASNNTTSNTAMRPTRPQPVLSVHQLTAIADSNLWLYPPVPQR